MVFLISRRPYSGVGVHVKLYRGQRTRGENRQATMVVSNPEYLRLIFAVPSVKQAWPGVRTTTFQPCDLLPDASKLAPEPAGQRGDGPATEQVQPPIGLAKAASRLVQSASR
jgi:hypothetical protein